MVDRQAAVCGVAAAFLALASIAVILRCYVRVRIVKAFGWDDCVMLAAMLFYIMFCGCMIGGSVWGTGRHLTNLTPTQRSRAMEYWWLCDIAYSISSVLAKVSVCIFLLRVVLFPYHRAALITVTALTAATGIVFFVLLVIQCSPVSYFWTRMAGDLDGQCGYIDAIAIMLYIFSVTSALFDFTVALLPVILVHKLQMDRRTKVAVAGLLGMACVASIAIIIRIPFVETIRDPDFLYATVEIAIWSCIEIGLSITAGSLATTRPLFRILTRTSPCNPFTHIKEHSNPSGSSEQRKEDGSRSGPSSRRVSARTHLGLDNALTGFNFGFSRKDNGSKARTKSRTGTPTRPSASLDKEHPGTGTGTGTYAGAEASADTNTGPEGNPNLDFFDPYIGVQMLNMRSRDMAGIPEGEEVSRSTPYSPSGTEPPNMHLVRSKTSAGVETGGSPVTVPAQAESGPGAGPGSGIGVRRSFRVSSGVVEEHDPEHEDQHGVGGWTGAGNGLWSGPGTGTRTGGGN